MLEQVAGDVFPHYLLYLGRRGPDVLQVHRNALAVLAVAKWLLVHVEIDAAGERIGDDQRRRHKVIRAHLGIDAAFKVAIAAEHRSDDEVFVDNDVGYFLWQRPRVTDASGTAIAHEVELQLLEIGHQAGTREVLGHHH